MMEINQPLCPICGAQILMRGTIVDTCEIFWDPEKKAFTIYIEFKDQQCECGYHTKKYETIPLLIAKQSKCLCGSTMILGKHDIKYVNGKLSFWGDYLCPKCGKQEATVSDKIMSILKAIWDKTEKIAIGPSGIEYQKKST